MADETIKLGIDFGPFAETAKGVTREMEALNLKLDEQRRELERLEVAWQKGHIGSAPQYRAAQKELQQDITATTRAIQVHQKELDNLASKSKSGGFAGGTQGINQLAFALDDFMGSSGGFAQKLNGISNNLQMVAMSMGMGGGWFLAVTGAISGLRLLVNNFDKLSSVVQGLPDPEELKKAADALQKKADAWKAGADAMAAKPDPGHEGGQAKAKATVDSVFAGKQAEDIRKGALSSALGFGGDFTGAELAELGGAEAEAKRLGDMRAENDALVKARVPGIAPTTITKAQVEAANAKVEEIKQKVAERTANRLMNQATIPGKAGAAARKQLAFMAKQNPGLFPGGLAEKLADIDSADNRAATEAMAAFGAEQDFQDLDMQLGFHGPPKPMRGFGMPQPQFAMPGNIDPRALQNKFGGENPAEFRKRQREQQAQNPKPNVMGPKGNMVFDPRFDELGNILERTQAEAMKTQGYVSRDAQRLAKLRAKTEQLEANNRELENQARQTLLPRGR